eukprot:Gregarina_sp_Poly_1__4458@NODE_23_length_20322_cov_242_373192_g21_i0_p2_GENE_NODE_23_length_20322_cov_242_373192_g21_i0NODE_23_length_20322_cov_242_373192_g21_i0_p2_ORF_typecomplete_len1166_score190_77Beach/PF02138_18/8_9e73ANAPC4_WD40/PF12894_7/9_8e06ANAPC4_WD40/PF12894_7/0_0014WD40/PF00400_32/1_2e02WD40/PF00400_32/0_05WD40/PF00400_32/2_5WD40_like/PF17005_5/0_0025DUF3110/PF11360_8/3_2e02DUF3110/PF11360_8/0_48GRAM/PF02893_20/0_16_NODE_23_length_20322_cov_242_373192_g21_i01682520322
MKTPLALFWLDGDEVCLCHLPSTFSLPFVKSTGAHVGRTQARLLLEVGSKGVIEGRLYLTNKGVSFFASRGNLEESTSSFIIKIDYTLIERVETSLDKSSSVLIYFRSFQWIPLRLIDCQWRNVENHRRLNEKPAGGDDAPPEEEEPSALFRIGDSNTCQRSDAIQFIQRLVNCNGDNSVIESMQRQSLEKLVAAKHILSHNILKNLAPPLFCCVQELLCKKLAAILMVPNGGFVLIELPDGEVHNFAFSRCVFAFERLVGTKIRGLELFYSVPTSSGVDSRSTVFVFDNEAEQQRFVQQLEAADPKLFAPQRDPAFLKHITDIWQQGRLSNFHYLQFLNALGGRSTHLLNRYPVFPWLVSNFALFDTESVAKAVTDCKEVSTEIEKLVASKNAANYRDLSKPVGALSHERLEALLERMSWLPRKDQYLFGSHYSTPDFVAHWKLRQLPELHLKLNHGKMDHFSRLFHSVGDSWDSVLRGQTSFMELVPEFFQADPTFLAASLPLERNYGDGRDQTIGPVALPPQCRCPFPLQWFGDPQKIEAALGPRHGTWEGAEFSQSDLESRWFLFMHRCLLEGDLVSRRLHRWIDLIFGHRQRGELAEESFNIFHPITYVSSELGASLLPSQNPKPTAGDKSPRSFDSSTLKQMEEFGQAPLQIFQSAHPARRAHLSALLTSAHTSKTLSVFSLFSHFLLFVTGSCKSPVAQVLSSVSWVALLQRCPKLLPLPSVTKRLESVAVDCADRSQVLCRMSRGKDKEESREILTWTGLGSAVQLDRRLTCVLPISGSANHLRIACHSNRMAVLTEGGQLSIFSLDSLAASGPPATQSLSCTKGPLAFSATGSHLICGSPAGCPTLINVAESVSPFRTPTCWAGHKGPVTCLGVNMRHHRVLATGGADESAALWDLDAGKVVSWWDGHAGSVLSCCQQGDLLATSACDSTILLRDVRCDPWTAPLWKAVLPDDLVCTDVVIGPRLVQAVVCARREPPKPSSGSACVDLLWRRLETLSAAPVSRRGVSVSGPRFLLSTDWRLLTVPVDAIALGSATSLPVSLGDQKIVAKPLDYLNKEGCVARVTAVRTEGENHVMIAGIIDDVSFVSLLDATSLQETHRWNLEKPASPLRILGFPNFSASLAADPLLWPSTAAKPVEEPVPFVLIHSENNVVDMLV